MWDEHLHRRDHHLCNALSTHRGVPDPETVVIPREIGKVLPHVFTTEQNHSARSTASSVGPEVV